MAGKIVAISVSQTRGGPKQNVSAAQVIENHGLAGDAHAGDWHRQVSLLAQESIDRLQEAGQHKLKLTPGMFAENITTSGIDLTKLQAGDRLRLGDTVLLEITQLGKECHTRCAIYQAIGDCVMPREGVFAKALSGGKIKVGDPVGTEE